MRHRISIRQIEGFLLASELLSFGRAAEAMHITQSAFSQLIRELESNLGVQLFERTTRRVGLTAAGEAMTQKLRRGLESIDEACDEAQAIARIDRGHVRIGALYSLAIGIVTRTLARMRQDVPGVTVSMREEFNDALVDLVAQDETDVSICAEVMPRPNLHFEYLFDDELMLVVRSDAPLARAQTLDWSALADQPLVMTARRTATRRYAAAALAAHGIDRPVEYEVASTPTALAMVRAGFGSTFVSRFALVELDTKGLHLVRMNDPPLRRLGIYRQADRSPSPACAKFLDLLRIETRATVARVARRDARARIQ